MSDESPAKRKRENPFAPWMNEILQNCIKPDLVTVIAEDEPDSLADLHRHFCAHTNSSVSLPTFKEWLDALNIKIKRQATIVVGD